MKFSELKIKPEILKALQELGFEEAFPIQEKAVPPALQNRDIIGKAQTGSGKTIAFAIPILNKITPAKHQQALIIAPTRELVLQICGELTKLAKHLRLKNLAIYGGKSMDVQVRGLREGNQIVVATPGRLIDHIERRTINLREIKFLVLDEADRMLDMGFIDDVEYIIKQLPQQRQTMLFSATLPERVKSMVHRYMKDHITIELNNESPTVSTVKQVAYIVEPSEKLKCLERILDDEKSRRCLIFCSMKSQARRLAHQYSRKYSVAAIHGDLSQNQREHVMQQFREGRVNHLIATDVAARGLDIEGISHVINFDLPNTVEGYVHRIGRTARAGAAGMAITLATSGETMDLLRIEHECKAKIDKMQFSNGEFLPVDPDLFNPRRAIIPRKDFENRGFGNKGGFRPKFRKGFRRGTSGGFRHYKGRRRSFGKR